MTIFEKDALADLLPGERLYQRFAGSVAFTRNGIKDRVIFADKMFREPATLADAEAHYAGDWRRYVSEHPEWNIAGSVPRVVYRCSETWCLTWFSHYTFDVGLSDFDVGESFHRYVMRCQCANERARNLGEQEPFPLMGADERYRWKSVCRCEPCQRLGIVRIDH